MRMIRRRAVAVAITTSVVLLGGAGAASAQTLTLRDARHDVWAGSSVNDPSAFTPAPHDVAGDVLRATLRYGTRNVVFTERYASLRRTGDGDLYALRLRTSGRVHRVIQVQAFRHSWAGNMATYRPNGRSVSCAGASDRIDYLRDLVRVRVPALCLGSPRWVQFTATSAHITRSDRWLLDNPHNDQAQVDTWSARVRRG